jgi:hypothetical protein
VSIGAAQPIRSKVLKRVTLRRIAREAGDVRFRPPSSRAEHPAPCQQQRSGQSTRPALLASTGSSRWLLLWADRIPRPCEYLIRSSLAELLSVGRGAVLSRDPPLQVSRSPALRSDRACGSASMGTLP